MDLNSLLFFGAVQIARTSFTALLDKTATTTFDALSELEKEEKVKIQFLHAELKSKISAISPCLSLCSQSYAMGQKSLLNAMVHSESVFTKATKILEEIQLETKEQTGEKVIERYERAIALLDSVVPFLTLAISCITTLDEVSPSIVPNIYARTTIILEQARCSRQTSRIGPKVRCSALVPHRSTNGNPIWKTQYLQCNVQLQIYPSDAGSKVGLSADLLIDEETPKGVIAV